jgi:hypothetical protein
MEVANTKARITKLKGFMDHSLVAAPRRTILSTINLQLLEVTGSVESLTDSLGDGRYFLALRRRSWHALGEEDMSCRRRPASKFDFNSKTKAWIPACAGMTDGRDDFQPPVQNS